MPNPADAALSISTVFSPLGRPRFSALTSIEVTRNSLASFTSWRNARVVSSSNNLVRRHAGAMVSPVAASSNEASSAQYGSGT